MYEVVVTTNDKTMAMHAMRAVAKRVPFSDSKTLAMMYRDEQMLFHVKSKNAD